MAGPEPTTFWIADRLEPLTSVRLEGRVHAQRKARARCSLNDTLRSSRWNEPRRVGLDIVANLYREGLDDWIDPTVIALNCEFDEPITAMEARGLFEEDLKLWPTLKKLQAVERSWQTSVRRRTYQWFIKSTFDT